MTVTPARSIRVPDELWARFGEAAELVGSNRNRTLVAFMTRFADAMATPPAWIADQASQIIVTTLSEDELPVKKLT